MGLKAPKKSESIEVRLPHPTKVAFMTKCRAEGRTASDAVRQFIEHELDTARRMSNAGGLRRWQALVAALVGLAVGAVAAPSLAHPTENSRAAFERLDKNHDGVLSFDEFRRD